MTHSLIASLRDVHRRRNTKDGNPRIRLVTDLGTYEIEPDSACAYRALPYVTDAYPVSMHLTLNDEGRVIDFEESGE